MPIITIRDDFPEAEGTAGDAVGDAVGDSVGDAVGDAVGDVVGVGEIAGGVASWETITS